MGLSDVRFWASSAQKGTERNFAVLEYAQYVLQLTVVPVSADAILREQYYRWVTDRVLVSVEQQQPEVFDWLVARARDLMVSGVEDALKEKT